MKDKICEVVLKTIREYGVKAEKDSTLADTVDSLTFVNVVVAIEDEFDIEFEDEMLSISKFETINGLVDYVDARIEDQQ